MRLPRWCAGFRRSWDFRRCWLGGIRRRRGRLRRSRLRLGLLLKLRLLALPLHLRIANEILPANNHEQRQHDGQNGVLVLAHSMLVVAVPFFAIHLALAPALFAPTRPMWGHGARCTSSTAAVAGATFADGPFTGAMDTAKRVAKFLHHGVKIDLERGTPPNQHVVMVGG